MHLNLLHFFVKKEDEIEIREGREGRKLGKWVWKQQTDLGKLEKSKLFHQLEVVLSYQKEKLSNM